MTRPQACTHECSRNIVRDPHLRELRVLVPLPPELVPQPRHLSGAEVALVRLRALLVRHGHELGELLLAGISNGW